MGSADAAGILLAPCCGRPGRRRQYDASPPWSPAPSGPSARRARKCAAWRPARRKA